MALVTLTILKDWFDISDTSEDTYLTTLASVIDSFVKRYCRRDIELTTYTDEYHDGTGMPQLFVDNYPVTSLDAVDFVGIYGGTTSMDTSYFRVHNHGELYYLYGNFPSGNRNICIDYKAGYSIVPADIVFACKIIGEDWYRKHKEGRFNLNNVKHGDVGFAVQMEIPPEAKLILDMNSKVRI